MNQPEDWELRVANWVHKEDALKQKLFKVQRQLAEAQEAARLGLHALNKDVPKIHIAVELFTQIIEG